MKLRHLFIFLILFAIALFFFLLTNQTRQSISNNISATPINIRYVPLGDSYTIGLGVDEKNRWPNILVDHLKNEGINISLIDNPAVSGYTVDDVINYELSAVKSLKPDLVTLLIGANDSFQTEEPAVFQKKLINLLDKLQPNLPNSKNIILITIPDHSKTPAFFQYQNQAKNIS